MPLALVLLVLLVLVWCWGAGGAGGDGGDGAILCRSHENSHFRVLERSVLRTSTSNVAPI